MRTPSILCLVALVACGSRESSKPAAMSAAVPNGADLPVAQLAIWPAQWPWIVKAVPPLAEALRGMPDASSFWNVVRSGLESLGAKGLALPPPGQQMMFEQARSLAGSSPDAVVLRWSAGDMIDVYSSGAEVSPLARPPIAPPPAAAAQCYRKVLLEVRRALQVASGSGRPSALADAVRALDAASCTGDPSIAKRQQTLREALAKLQPQLVEAAKAPHRSAPADDDDPPPPPLEEGKVDEPARPAGKRRSK
jgi:hypothetical protein